MEAQSPKDSCSDDEIFFGRLSIKEIKKHIFLDRTRQTISSFDPSSNEKDDSLCLIETHSEPAIYSVQDITIMDLTSNMDLDSSALQNIGNDDNMLGFEKSAKLCQSPVDTREIQCIPLKDTGEIQCISIKDTGKIQCKSLKDTGEVQSKSLNDTGEVQCKSLKDSEKILCKLPKDKNQLLCDSLNDNSQILNESSEDKSQILYKSLKDSCQLLCESVKDKSQILNDYANDNSQILCKSLKDSPKNTSQESCKLTKDTSHIICKSAKNISQILDSTPDVVEFILNNDPQKDMNCVSDHIEPNTFNREIISSDVKSACSSEFVSPLKSTESDESFLKLETMVSRLCTSSKEDPSLVLDSTLDVVDYILNNKQLKSESCIGMTVENEEKCLESKIEFPSTCSINLQTDVQMIDKQENITNQEDYLSQGAKKQINLKTEPKCTVASTPWKNSNCTPKLKQDHVFKTPKNLSCQKPSTPYLKKSNAYQHITSPIASYIKNCPQAPLFKKVDPKKPLPGISAIPKLLKIPVNSKTDNKENIQLPPIAYKSAKKTEMISLPDKAKTPQVQWIKKLTTSLPKPAVIKHDHRQVNSSTKPQATQEDSFANLTLHQAELSVCTKKSAF